jgi:hypothetical protein
VLHQVPQSGKTFDQSGDGNSSFVVLECCVGFQGWDVVLP